MIPAFGPWAMTIDVGNQPQLSAFWKRMLKMLPRVCHSRRRAACGARLTLAIAALGLLAAPLLYFSPVAAEQREATQPTSRSETGSPDIAAHREPKLQFVADYYRRPASWDDPVEGIYWRPSGERVTDQDELMPLHRVRVWPESNRPRAAGFLYLFVSHPEFVDGPWGRIDVLDQQGEPIDESLYNVPWKGTAGPLGAPAAERLRGPGWQFYQIPIKSGIDLPERGMVHLHYVTGTGRRLARITIDAEPGEPLASGVTLRGIGENGQGQAEVRVAADADQHAQLQYRVYAKTQNGQDVDPDGVEKREQTYRFTFRHPLSELAEFHLFARQKRSVLFEDVHFQPEPRNGD